MLIRLHETSNYSAERQLYTLMNELLQQNSIVANDVKMRITEIMTGNNPKFINQAIFVKSFGSSIYIPFQILPIQTA